MPNLESELYYGLGAKIIAGIDEAGRGPLAGPVVAAAVVIDSASDPQSISNTQLNLCGVNDSKKLSSSKREVLYNKIIDSCYYSVGIVSVEEIEKYNILNATIEACVRAANALSIRPEIVIVDGNMKFTDKRFISLIKGDTKSLSVASASIIAKVTRDRLMNELDLEYPQYLWHKNAGYGTKEHIDAIKRFGPCKHHRKSFLTKILA